MLVGHCSIRGQKMAWLLALRLRPLSLIALLFATSAAAQTQIDIDWARTNSCSALNRFVGRYGSGNSYSQQVGERRSQLCPRRQPQPQPRAIPVRRPFAEMRETEILRVRTAQDERERRVVEELNQQVLQGSQAFNAQVRADQEDFARRQAAHQQDQVTYQGELQAVEQANQRYQREMERSRAEQAEYQRRLAEHRRILATGNFSTPR